jgi:hemolysin activation/secretion protein
MNRLATWGLVAALLGGSALAQADSAAPRRVERLALEGNRVLPMALLEAVAAPWLGRALDEAEIEQLRQALTRAYVERGYVNSGLLLLAEPDAAGTLRLRAVEGRLAKVRISGLDGLDERHVLARLAWHPDAVLNMDALRERFQLLLADPLVARANARLMPGERSGEALLVLELQRARPWQLQAQINNHRPVSVGEWQAGVQGQVHNLTGFGDRLDLSLNRALAHSGQGQVALGWRWPLTGLGWSATQLQLGTEHSDAAVVEEPVARLDIESRVRSLELGLAQTVWESPAERLALGLQHQQRRQSSTLLGQRFFFLPNLPEGEALRAGVWRLWQEASWRSSREVLALRSSFTFGHSNVLPETLQSGVEPAPAPRFAYWTGQAQWVRRIEVEGVEGLQGTLRGTVQLARDRLLPQDGLSAGGVRSVRGQRENALLRDEGWVLNFELELPIAPQAWNGLRLLLQPFYDHARLRNRGQRWATLSSWGLALQLQAAHWSLELVAAKRLQQQNPPTHDSAWQDQGLHAQVVWRF